MDSEGIFWFLFIVKLLELYLIVLELVLATIGLSTILLCYKVDSRKIFRVNNNKLILKVLLV